MPLAKEKQVLRYINKHGIVRPQDLASHGWARTYLQRLEKKGLIKRLSRGLYLAEGAKISERHSLAEVCKRVPNAVICLLSALRFHNLTTQLPSQVWITLDIKARKPIIDHPEIRVIRSSGVALKEGIEYHLVEGVKVRVYSIPKTVADCFKYRNKIGLDVAIEALRDCRNKRLATFDELWYYAKLCRVAKIMEPYLQAIV